MGVDGDVKPTAAVGAEAEASVVDGEAGVCGAGPVMRTHGTRYGTDYGVVPLTVGQATFNCPPFDLGPAPEPAAAAGASQAVQFHRVGVDSISFGSPHVRPTGVRRACGEL